MNGLIVKEENIKEQTDGKNMDSLARSRQIRANFVSEFGLVPSSILVNNRQDRAIDLSKGEGRDYITISRKIAKSFQTKAEIQAWETSHRGARQGALSAFPQNIGRLLVKFYCPKHGIVLDVFAGHNSRMQLVYESGRSYVGMDVSKKFMEHNRQIKKILEERGLIKSDNFIKLIEGSSHQVPLPDNYADFSITSPPYWNIEDYGDEPEQLGKAKTYEDFLKLISRHIKETYRVLKPNTFCCWNINDFIKDRHYHAYHADLIPIFLESGFSLHTIYIIDLGLPVQAAFIQVTLKTKRFPKQHEYVLVFRR